MLAPKHNSGESQVPTILNEKGFSRPWILLVPSPKAPYYEWDVVCFWDLRLMGTTGDQSVYWASEAEEECGVALFSSRLSNVVCLSPSLRFHCYVAYDDDEH